LSRLSGRSGTIGSRGDGEVPGLDPSLTPRIRGSSARGEQGTAAKWLLAGLPLLVGGLALAVVAAGEGILPGDIAIAHAVQRPPSATIDRAASFASEIGADFASAAVIAVIGTGLLIILGRRDLALFLGVAAALRAIGPVLKMLIASPRPTAEAVVIVARSDGLGFPSGHALGAALLYGAIAIIAPQIVADRFVVRAIQVIAIALMVLIALSRVRLGVHWPSDVVGGLLFGLGAVCLLQAAFLTWRHAGVRR
jgi:membrane-associated phospholipid phosphatase